jgi:SAM-dependent methyltransferase
LCRQATLTLDSWLSENDARVDWSLFSLPWDSMQLRHNPFREEQIEAILRSARVFEKESPIVLDLGCGPGVLGRLLMREKPMAQYYGLDGDPLMLAAMQHLVQGEHVHALREDLRETEWSRPLLGRFDSVISLTALHWLSVEHQRQIYLAAFEVLKPGGTFIVGDPYQPEDIEEWKKLETLHEERASRQNGQTWGEFWESFFNRYSIKQLYTEYHIQEGYQIPFEGSDDGYPLSSHLKALREIGFSSVSVFWTADLRAVYGGTK